MMVAAVALDQAAPSLSAWRTNVTLPPAVRSIWSLPRVAKKKARLRGPEGGGDSRSDQLEARTTGAQTTTSLVSVHLESPTLNLACC